MQNIRRPIIISTFLTLTNAVFGQTVGDAYAMLNRKQIDSSLAAARNIIKRDSSIPQAYEIAGRSLFRKYRFVEAIGYLEKVHTFDNVPLSSKAWTMHDLGVSYYSLGDYGKAKENLFKSLEMKESKDVASHTLLGLGFDDLYDTWAMKESSHFIFHFQDIASVGDVASYIMKKEKAFDLINNFFKVKLPKKIDYFVWNDLKKGEVLLKTPLAFTEPPLCLTHTGIANTLGHEMTHSISYFAAKPIKKNYLISEGVCVYFDLTKRDKVAQLKNINHSEYSLIDVWKGKLRVGNDIIYPLGGELVKRLIESFGREKFIQLLVDQSYEHARNLYGEKLDDLISGLQKDIRR